MQTLLSSPAKYLKFHGYEIIPVNPMYDTVLGLTSYPDLEAIPSEKIIDVVDIFRKPEAVPEIVDAAIKRGVKVIWMQEGVINNQAAKTAQDANLKVVMNKCIRKEHMKLIHDTAH